MSSAFYGLAKAAIYDLIDWQCWHGPPPMMPSAVHAMHSLLGPLDESRACQYRGIMSGVHGRRGEQREAHLLAVYPTFSQSFAAPPQNLDLAVLRVYTSHFRD